MKKKNIILSLAMALMVSIGATTYASTTPEETNEGKGYNCSFNAGNGPNLRGYDILINLIKSKGVTDAEIDSTKTTGNSLHDLAVEKGITNEEIKYYMVNERIENIDELVASGKLTAEEGETAKTTIAENSANCTGEGQVNGNKGSMNGGNKGQRGSCRTN